MDNWKKTAPDGMKNVDMASWWWAFLKTEIAFLSQALKGMVIASVLCFIILLVAIRNVI